MGDRHKNFKDWMLIELINNKNKISKNRFFNRHALHCLCSHWFMLCQLFPVSSIQSFKEIVLLRGGFRVACTDTLARTPFGMCQYYFAKLSSSW
jgi:hypothetical protein